jgi:hypothetical protein
MMKYEVHLAVELPFWMALPAEEFSVVLDGSKHRIKTSNEVVRIDVGDFYRRPGGYLVKWVRESDRESETQELERQYPDLPVFQRKARTILTHLRTLSAPDDAAMMRQYESRAERWTEESITVVNRFIECYRIAAVSVGDRQEAINVSKWEVESAIASVWRLDNGMTQIGGRIQLLRESPPPPKPMPDAELQNFKRTLGRQPPLVTSLLDGAAGLIPRGRWRNAVVDAVTALEVAAAKTVEELASAKGIPDDVANYLAQEVWFRDHCTSVIPALGGPNLASTNKSLWRHLEKVRRKRNNIVHKGHAANHRDALNALELCTEAAQQLAQRQ